MSLRDATLFLEVRERVGRQEVMIEALQAEIATLRMRLGSLQGQINSLRALTGRIPIPEPPPDAPANAIGEGDAARQ